MFYWKKLNVLTFKITTNWEQRRGECVKMDFKGILWYYVSVSWFKTWVWAQLGLCQKAQILGHFPPPGNGGGVRIKLSPRSTVTLLWGYGHLQPEFEGLALSEPARRGRFRHGPPSLTAQRSCSQLCKVRFNDNGWRWSEWGQTKTEKKQRTEIQLPPTSHQPKRRNIESKNVHESNSDAKAKHTFSLIHTGLLSPLRQTWLIILISHRLE